MTSNNIIPSPEVQRLKNECYLLRDELAALLSEREHLLTAVAPNILAIYATSIGIKEYEALCLDVEVRKLKAIIEKIQAIENQAKHPNLEQIEAAVADELKEWHNKINSMVEEIQESRNRIENQMSSETFAEFHKLYRTLVKKLHPDINPDISEKQKLLWARIQQAYASGDLQEMRALELMVEDIPEDLRVPNQLDYLRKRCDRLKSQAHGLIRQIADIKNNPPFTLASKLDDPEWVQTQVHECEQRMAVLTEEKKNLENWLSIWRKKK